jgi:hypothetical protein
MSHSSFACTVTVPSAQAKEATSARGDRERGPETAHMGHRSLQHRLKLLTTRLEAAAPQGDVHDEQDPLVRSSSLQQAGV